MSQSHQTQELPNSREDKQGIIFLAQGTLNIASAIGIKSSLENLCAKFSDIIGLPKNLIRYAFLDYTEPALESSLESICSSADITEVKIMPLMLFPNENLKNEVEKAISSIFWKYPKTSFQVVDSIGIDEPEFLEILRKKV